MKKKNFTIIELLVVMTIMSILLGISMQVLKPDRAKAAIKQVGGSITAWSARAMSESTSYRLEFTKNLIEVYNINNELVYSKKTMSPLSFFDHADIPQPLPDQTIVFNKFGSMGDLRGARIYADTWIARVNGFTGHLSYYEEEEDE
jgi:prepilin-type N-terminal cleavage/methylation domain-containing protein